MNWKSEYKPLLWISGLFIIIYFLPVEKTVFTQSLTDAFTLLKWYAREHVLLCLVPAFFIAGGIAVFISQAAVIKYFGAGAKKWISYLVASVSGSILAVCSCTILPLFAGIYKRGAGIGPATAFLYAGPGINILAIILTARILGFELGIARVVGAIAFSIIIGLLMHFFFRKEEQEKAATQLSMPETENTRPLWQTVLHFTIMIGILVFATWGKPESVNGFWGFIYTSKWKITSLLGVGLGFSLIYILNINKVWVFSGMGIVAIISFLPMQTPVLPFITGVIAVSILLSQSGSESSEWMSSTWGFTKQIMPLLAAGVLVSGFLLGSPEGGNGIIPETWISSLVGGNSIFANFFASVVGAFMYFATLTEVPILQGLIANGMGKGPALALLLAGPALSLPNMLVIKSVIGMKKTMVFVLIVIIMSTFSGIIFGAI